MIALVTVYLLVIGYLEKKELAVNTCRCCNQPMNIYTQPSMLPNRPSYQLAECVNSECKLFMVTLSAGVHEKLTAQQIAGYAKVNQRQRKAAART